MTLSLSVKLSKKGQFVIPLVVRKALGVKEGDELLLILTGTRITLTRPEERAKATRGLIKGAWGKTGPEVERYLERERGSWK